MVNHPNRKRLPWHVTVNGALSARFLLYADAHFFARRLSADIGCGTEVHSRDAIFGQYVKGRSTPEFERHAVEAATMARD
jgi:hypothetical protein